METSKEIVKQDTKAVTQKDVDDYLFGSGTKLTEAQKTLFYNIAISCQLNPLKREIYAVVYGQNFNLITGYEVYLKRAERTGLLDYWRATVRHEDGEWIGVCEIKRKDRSEATVIEAWLDEYEQKNKMWQEKPRTMIRKVAIAQAFRMVFPDELGGLPYTFDEMPSEPVIVAATVGDVHDKPQTPQKTKRKQPSTPPENNAAETVSEGQKWGRLVEKYKSMMLACETREELKHQGRMINDEGKLGRLTKDELAELRKSYEIAMSELFPPAS